MVRFGGIVALDGVSFDIGQNQILGLIGPNGAGKTTLFNCVSRLYIPDSGEISFEGQSILNAPPHRIADIGISRTVPRLALNAPGCSPWSPFAPRKSGLTRDDELSTLSWSERRPYDLLCHEIKADDAIW